MPACSTGGARASRTVAGDVDRRARAVVRAPRDVTTCRGGMTTDPWAVLVSEVMLQQTSVARVLPRWSRFLERWPTADGMCRGARSTTCCASGRGSATRAAPGRSGCSPRTSPSTAGRATRRGCARCPGSARTRRARCSRSATSARAAEAPPRDVNLGRVAARAALGCEPHEATPAVLDATLRATAGRGAWRCASTRTRCSTSGPLHCRARPVVRRVPAAGPVRVAGARPRPAAAPRRRDGRAPTRAASASCAARCWRRRCARRGAAAGGAGRGGARGARRHARADALRDRRAGRRRADAGRIGAAALGFGGGDRLPRSGRRPGARCGSGPSSPSSPTATCRRWRARRRSGGGPRVLFAGFPSDYSLAFLLALLELDVEVVGAAHLAGRARGHPRRQRAEPDRRPPRASRCCAPGASTTSTPSSTSRALRLDGVVMASFDQIIGSRALAVPAHGWMNIHPSALPARRGPEPVYWTIADGDPIAGITLHRAVPKVDAGPILAQRTVEVSEDDTSGTLTRRLCELGTAALGEAVDRLLTDWPGEPIDMTGATYAPSVGHRHVDAAPSADGGPAHGPCRRAQHAGVDHGGRPGRLRAARAPRGRAGGPAGDRVRRRDHRHRRAPGRVRMSSQSCFLPAPSGMSR